MSNPGTSGRVRPSTVSISSYLLYLVAALQVVNAIVAFATAGTLRDILEKAYAGVADGDKIAAFTSAFLIGASVLGMLVGVGLVVLATLNNRGKNASRIVTWVVGGLFACCAGFGVLGSLAGGSTSFGAKPPAGAPSQAEIQRLIEDGMPGWLQPVQIIVGVIGLLALIGALVLLALPPSNEYFRKAPPAPWQPPDTPGYQPHTGS